MKKIDFSPENIGKLCQKAVDEAIERHRIKGESLAISEHGKVKIVPPEDIIPLADKLDKIVKLSNE
jgi:hypothetical protein